MKTVHVAAAVMIRGDRVYATQRDIGGISVRASWRGSMLS